VFSLRPFSRRKCFSTRLSCTLPVDSPYCSALFFLGPNLDRHFFLRFNHLPRSPWVIAQLFCHDRFVIVLIPKSLWLLSPPQISQFTLLHCPFARIVRFSSAPSQHPSRGSPKAANSRCCAWFNLASPGCMSSAVWFVYSTSCPSHRLPSLLGSFFAPASRYHPYKRFGAPFPLLYVFDAAAP